MNLMITVFKEMYGVNDYVILQKNGEKAGQSVPHLHFHMIPVRDPSNRTIERAFQFREKLSDEEMSQALMELHQFFYEKGEIHAN